MISGYLSPRPFTSGFRNARNAAINNTTLMLPETLQNEMKGKELRDFGLVVHDGEFSFHETYCVTPSSLVLAYSLAIGMWQGKRYCNGWFRWLRPRRCA